MLTHACSIASIKSSELRFSSVQMLTYYALLAGGGPSHRQPQKSCFQRLSMTSTHSREL